MMLNENPLFLTALDIIRSCYLTPATVPSHNNRRGGGCDLIDSDCHATRCRWCWGQITLVESLDQCGSMS